jgi:hypothetical protein
VGWTPWRSVTGNQILSGAAKRIAAQGYGLCRSQCKDSSGDSQRPGLGIAPASKATKRPYSRAPSLTLIIHEDFINQLPSLLPALSCSFRSFTVASRHVRSFIPLKFASCLSPSDQLSSFVYHITTSILSNFNIYSIHGLLSNTDHDEDPVYAPCSPGLGPWRPCSHCLH